MITIIEAIKSLNPNAGVLVGNNDIDDITWLDGATSIPKKEIEAEVIRLQAEYDAKQYQRDRAVVYPSIQEQLDMQYWDSVNGTTKWKDAIAKVKTDNPKPE